MNFNKALVFLTLILSAACSLKTSSNDSILKSSPNVLFIAVDDLRPELGCYGKDFIYSPNIDELAKQGTVFTNHFVTVPTCGASRHSILTGMLPRTKGHLSNDVSRNLISGKPERAEPETFIHHLRRNGYYTVGIGKISHYADGLVYGYTDSVSTERELPYSWDELLFDPGKWETGWNAFFGYASGENRQSLNKQVKPYENADVPDTGYPDGLTAELALQKLEDLAQKREPFFLGVGFFKPHLPFNAPQKYWDMYDEDEIPISPNPDIPENVNSASLQGSGEFNGYQLGEEKASLEGPMSDEYARKIRHAYFASISYVDAQVGKLLDELDRLGLTENTIVVLWGDHGWHLGDQLVWGKHTIFDRALNSAFILKVPGKTHGQKVDQVVAAVDVYPTLMDLCDVDMPYEMDGQSIVPILENPADEWRGTAYSYYNDGISLRTNRYRMTKYFRKQTPLIELYDHQNDPNETVNIASRRPEVIEQLMPVWEAGNTGIYQSD